MREVYLCGPITGSSETEVNNWRELVYANLNAEGIKTISPTRVNEVIFKRTNDDDSLKDTKLISDLKSIVTRDRFDTTKRADMLIVNLLGAEKVSIGSMIELGWADSHRVPVIVVMEQDNIHNHAFVREIAGWIVDSVEEAVEIAKAVLK